MRASTRLSPAVIAGRGRRWLAVRLHVVRSLYEWSRRGFGMPSPDLVKRAVLMRWGSTSSTWIETGTYLGSTTEYLAQRVSRVISIEPQPALVVRARQRLRRYHNVEIVEGTSEDQLRPILMNIEGDVCFWLDGHYSAGSTYRGSQDTPVLDELAAISEALPRLGRVVVFIDDLRCFEPAAGELNGYPSRSELVTWADTHHFSWVVEHDIFVARRGPA